MRHLPRQRPRRRTARPVPWAALTGCLLTLALTGCLAADAPVDDAALVEHVWHLVDTRYALFVDKPEVDWPAARTRALDALAAAPSPASDAALFDIIADLLATLDDGHTNLAAGFDVSGDRARAVPAPRLYDADLVERRVLNQEHRRAAGAIYARLEADMGYIRLSSFDAVPGEDALDVIFAGFDDAAGLIIDLRSNGGGSLEDMYRLLARLVDTPSDGLRVSFSAGPGHAALTPPEPRDFEPAPGPRYTGPVAVLVDGHTYSAANAFTVVIRRRQRVTIVGQPTGGGGGLPHWVELPNGWLLRLSTGRLTDPDGASLEAGLAPDVDATLAPGDRAAGRDSMIDAALTALSGL